MHTETNTASENYEAWLIRRAREAAQKARETPLPGTPDLARELRLARATGELCAWVTALTDALEAREPAARG